MDVDLDYRNNDGFCQNRTCVEFPQDLKMQLIDIQCGLSRTAFKARMDILL